MKKSAMQAEIWLPWRKSSNAPDIGTHGGLNVTADVCRPCQHHGDPAGPIPCLPLPSGVPPYIPHHQVLTPMPKAGCRYTHWGCIDPIWKHHHFPQLQQSIFLILAHSWRWWHCAGGSSHAKGLAGSDHTLVSPGQGCGQLEEQRLEIPCMQLSSSSTHPWRMR